MLYLVPVDLHRKICFLQSLSHSSVAGAAGEVTHADVILRRESHTLQPLSLRPFKAFWSVMPCRQKISPHEQDVCPSSIAAYPGNFVIVTSCQWALTLVTKGVNVTKIHCTITRAQRIKANAPLKTKT